MPIIQVPSWKLNFHNCYKATPSDPKHFEDLGLTLKHITWELQKCDKQIKTLFDKRMRLMCKFPGLHTFNKCRSKLITDEVHLTATEYASIRCLVLFALYVFFMIHTNTITVSIYSLQKDSFVGFIMFNMLKHINEICRHTPLLFIRWQNQWLDFLSSFKEQFQH